MSPIEKHCKWPHLVREVQNLLPATRGVDSLTLSKLLFPAASVARWIVLNRRDLLNCKGIDLVVAGAAAVDMWDLGRWYQLIPWMVGRPELHLRVTLVGPAMRPERDLTMAAYINVKDMGSFPVSPFASIVRHLRPADQTHGLLSDWAKLNRASPDLCVLFHPGFSVHHERWFPESELTHLIRKKVDILGFSYSLLDFLSDRDTAEAYGINGMGDGIANPWAVETPDVVGRLGHWCWSLRNVHLPDVLEPDQNRLDDWEAAENLTKDEWVAGGDAAVMGIGKLVDLLPTPGAATLPRIASLPKNFAVDLDSGLVYVMTQQGLSPHQPKVVVPADVLKKWPADAIVKRVIWACDITQTYIIPASGLLFGESFQKQMMDPERIKEILHSFQGDAAFPKEFIDRAIATLTVHNIELVGSQKQLHQLLDRGRYADAMALLKAEPELSTSVGPDRTTLLMRASEAGHLKMVEFCLKHGADANEGAPDGFLPLHMASRVGNVEVMNLLLNAGADPTTQTAMGWSSLMMAVQNGFTDAARLLISKGAKTSETMPFGTTVREYAQQARMKL